MLFWEENKPRSLFWVKKRRKVDVPFFAERGGVGGGVKKK
jgi:hypothetical protein